MSHRILVIADDRPIAYIVGEILQLDGHQVLSASDGEEGLKLAVEQRPDLIIVDLDMVDEDGWSFTWLLRANTAMAEIPLVAMSVVAQSERWLRKPPVPEITACLGKPFDLDELLNLVRALLEGKRA